jgi:hypothetical protein
MLRIVPLLSAIGLLWLSPHAAGAQEDVAAPEVSEEMQSEADAAFAPLAAADVTLDSFVWKKRPLVVFANTPEDPAFVEQLRQLEARWPELRARDVVIITDTAPQPLSSVRKALRPRGFSLVIVEKDGTVALRKPFPWDGREIMRAIDKMPIRREEIRNGGLGASG